MSGKDRNNEARHPSTQAEDSETQGFIRKYLKLADIALGAEGKPRRRQRHVKARKIDPQRKAA